MNTSKIISIILPIYNAKRTLSRCIDSVLAQTYTHIELVCIDDAGTDGSNKLLAKYAKQDERIKVVSLKENKGPAAARNIGLSKASGEYIAFIDADDFMDAPLLERLITLAESQKSELVVCEHYAFRENTKDEKGIYENPIEATERIVGFSKLLRENLGLSGEFFNYQIDTPETLGKVIANISDYIWGRLFDAKIIKKLELRFPEGLSYGEDTLFLAEYLSAVKKVSFLAEPLYHYNAYSKHSITNTLTNKWFDIYENLGAVLNFYREFYSKSDFKRILPYLSDLSSRYYDRRANALHRHKDKRLQIRFVRHSMDFLDKNFPGWKARMHKLPGVRLGFIKSNLFLMRLYILAPNALKRLFIPAKLR